MGRTNGIRPPPRTPPTSATLAEGGRRQQPGSPVYAALLTEAEARAALERP